MAVKFQLAVVAVACLIAVALSVESEHAVHHNPINDDVIDAMNGVCDRVAEGYKGAPDWVANRAVRNCKSRVRSCEMRASEAMEQR